MGDLVNLRQARKRKERGEKAKSAEQNRASHGRTRHERTLTVRERQKADKQHDGHKRADGDAGQAKVTTEPPKDHADGSGGDKVNNRTKNAGPPTDTDETNVISIFSPERPSHD